MAKQVSYNGSRGHYSGNATVERSDGYYLKPRNNWVNHSPGGFEWGYGGSGPSQLSLAILADTLEERIGDKGSIKALALHNYQSFKWDVVSRFNRSKFAISQDVVWRWYEDNGQTPEYPDDYD